MYMICKDFDLEEFEPWGETAINTKEKIVDAGKADTFSDQIRELYPDGIPEVTMNDLLWFDRDWCFESVGISDCEDDDDEEDEEDESDSDSESEKD
jgi:hypothetical protein